MDPKPKDRRSYKRHTHRRDGEDKKDAVRRRRQRLGCGTSQGMPMPRPTEDGRGKEGVSPRGFDGAADQVTLWR